MRSYPLSLRMAEEDWNPTVFMTSVDVTDCTSEGITDRKEKQVTE